MFFTTTLLALAAATSALTIDKRQYTGQPGFPQAIVLVEKLSDDRTTDTYTTVKIPLTYGLTSDNTPALKEVSYLSVAGGIGNIAPDNIDCVTDQGVHFNSKTPFKVLDLPTEIKVVKCEQGVVP